MLVVLLGQLVVHLAVPEVDAVNQPLPFETRDGSKDRRVVGGAELLNHRGVKLVDRPEMAVFV